jgi:hypothetical protein
MYNMIAILKYSVKSVKPKPSERRISSRKKEPKSLLKHSTMGNLNLNTRARK